MNQIKNTIGMLGIGYAKKKLWLIFAVIIVVILGFLIWLAFNATVGQTRVDLL